MVTVEKKQDEQKQGGNPSVVDAFISALFASAPSPSSPIAATSSSASPYIGTTPDPSSMDNQKTMSEDNTIRKHISAGANIHESNIEGYVPATRSTTPADRPSANSETFSASNPTAAVRTRTAVKRERSLTEEVEAYSQLSKRKIAQPLTTTSSSKRFDEPVCQRYDHGRGLRETGNVSPGRGGSDRGAYDQQHQRYQNQRTQQQQQHNISNALAAPPSSTYRGKAEIVPYHLQAHRGQPASSTYILALKPVDWNTAVAESRMLIRDVPTHMDNWDLLDHFAPYGEIIEVVIKNQLGFVHFADATACQAAVESENGKFIKDFKLKLEVCKQKPHFARGNHTVVAKTVAPPKIQHQTPIASTHVHLLVWDHVPSPYVHYVSQSFERASLPTQISYLVNRPATNQELIIREKANSGAVAVLNLEHRHEQQRTVDLRVLNISYNENIHFEAYDSISLDDAIALTKLGCSSNRSVSKSPTQDQSAPVRNPPPQQQQQHPPLELATIQQLDVNTLAAIYDLVHVQLETALAAHQRTTSGQQQQQYGHSPYKSAALYEAAPALSYQQFSRPTLPHAGPSSSTAPMNTRSFYHYPHYPLSSPQTLTAPINQDPIPLSTEQLGNILSSVNSNR